MTELGEPWRIEDGLMVMRNGYIIGEGEHIDRIVACVNACAGVTTEQLIYLRPGILSGIAAEHQPLAWRKEPPNRSGCWWMLPPDHEPIAICAMADRHGHVMVSFGSTICYVDDKYLAKCKFAGPIEPPEAPNA